MCGAGLALTACGCARKPVASRPAPVYVSVARLVPMHPQYPELLDLNARIAWLRAVSPRQAAAPTPSALRMAVPVTGRASADVSALQREIMARLDAVIANQSAEAARTREVQGSTARLPENIRVRERIADRTASKLDAVIERHSLVMRNLLVKLSAIRALERYYDARKWDRASLTAQESDTEARLDAVRKQADAEVAQALADLRADFADEERRNGALGLPSTDNPGVDALREEIQRQKASIGKALAGIAPPALAPAAAPAPPAPFTQAVSAPALPEPGLGTPIATLVDHRDTLARFIDQSTRARVKAEAGRRGETAQFIIRPGLPDRSDAYRSAVAGAF